MHQLVHLHLYMHADFNYHAEVANLFGHAHYFSQSVSGMSNKNRLTNGDFHYPVCDILNGDIKPMILENVLVSEMDDKFDQEDEGSDIIYATPEELEEDSCSRDSSSFGMIILKDTKF